ncbi:MAG: polysaccharide pyruvyl transferase family protein [Oscillospiraceae bacterium]|nr:polysaccharide pyruvyl transferase family protein [Oscillospiraceae bacterium]
MKKYGIVTYTIYFNFVNYGSMLQCYAVQQTLNKLGVDNVVVDYCNDTLLTKDMDDPLKNMLDKRLSSRLGCWLSYPHIRKANRKFYDFWNTRYRKTDKLYTSQNFNELEFDGFICGGDTIWDTKESAGFDRGFFADFDCMHGKHNITFSQSVGDSPFAEEDRSELTRLLKNFKHISLRETNHMGIIDTCTELPINSTIDPTLLLDRSDYEKIIKEEKQKKPYILLYSRSYNAEMNKFADKLAKKHKLKVIDISLRIQNFYKHKMAYNTSVEEFLGLVKNAEYVVTNSYHGMIFAMQFRREFYVFSRPGCFNKIKTLLEIAAIESRMLTVCENDEQEKIDYDDVWERIAVKRADTIAYLKEALNID